MVKRSRVDLVAGKVGDNVAVPIPPMDRGRGDPRNILGVIVSCDDNMNYRIATRSGVLNGRYSRNQFDVCSERLLTENDVNQDAAISLRLAVIQTSISGGQGFVKCGYNGVIKCITNRCKCFKARILCNSRCHSCLSCFNK